MRVDKRPEPIGRWLQRYLPMVGRPRDIRKDITRPEIQPEYRSRVDRLAQRIREWQAG